MNLTPKTIQIYLPSGEPQGIRIAEITTRIVQVIEVPRSKLSEFVSMDESRQVAIYFLIGGKEDDSDQHEVYIGQTGDLQGRLASHNRQKDFWERVLVAVSKTHSLTQTHGLLLEWSCIQAIRDAGRYRDLNGNSGSRPHAPAPLASDCDEIFETMSTLLATLGHPLFTKFVTSSDVDSPEPDLFYCTSSDADAKGQLTSEGFVVFAGSSGRKDVVNSIVGHRDERRRQELVENGICRIEGDRMIFEKDFLFGSPSVAASAVMGRSGNGWIDWRDENGRTLDEVYRQSEES